METQKQNPRSMDVSRGWTPKDQKRNDAFVKMLPEITGAFERQLSRTGLLRWINCGDKQLALEVDPDVSPWYMYGKGSHQVAFKISQEFQLPDDAPASFVAKFSRFGFGAQDHMIETMLVADAVGHDVHYDETTGTFSFKTNCTVLTCCMSGAAQDRSANKLREIGLFVPLTYMVNCKMPDGTNVVIVIQEDITDQWRYLIRDLDQSEEYLSKQEYSDLVEKSKQAIQKISESLDVSIVTYHSGAKDKDSKQVALERMFKVRMPLAGGPAELVLADLDHIDICRN